jgi:hypothetical protein
MEAPGKGMLKVVSILFIIFGAIAAIIFLIVGVIGALVAGTAVGIIAILLALFGLILAAVELVIGIIGLKKCEDVSQAGFFITTGIVLCVLQFISLVWGIASTGFNFTSFIGFVLPILYIVGGNMNKKAVAKA